MTFIPRLNVTIIHNILSGIQSQCHNGAGTLAVNLENFHLGELRTGCEALRVASCELFTRPDGLRPGRGNATYSDILPDSRQTTNPTLVTSHVTQSHHTSHSHIHTSHSHITSQTESHHTSHSHITSQTESHHITGRVTSHVTQSHHIIGRVTSHISTRDSTRHATQEWCHRSTVIFRPQKLSIAG